MAGPNLLNCSRKKALLLSTKKIYDNQLPEWTQDLVESKGFTISPKGLALLVDHIGNDLTRIENEIEKISLILEKEKLSLKKILKSSSGSVKSLMFLNYNRRWQKKTLPRLSASFNILRPIQKRPRYN